MLKTNSEKLIQISVQGKIQHPMIAHPYRIDRQGTAHILPATGGIVYNLQIGDDAMGWVSDHAEPGVTIRNDDIKSNLALNLYSCIGNRATVVSGDAKGACGYVTGTHGGIEHVMAYFAADDLEKMVIDDRIQIKAWGQGLTAIDYPEISVMNIDPHLFGQLGISERDGKFQVPVAGVVPPYLMGSGLGAVTAGQGDYDIMTTDRKEIQQQRLDKLKLGDLVLLQDCDNSFGRAYAKGAVTIGVVIHGDSIKMGHGPGVTVIMTSPRGHIEGVIDDSANIARYLKVTA